MPKKKKKPAPPRHFEATNEEYHQRPGISHSQLEVFIDDPGTYYRRFVTKEEPKPKPTAAMEFGSSAHQWLLEDGGNIVEIPPDALSTTGRRQGHAWKLFEAQNPGKLLRKSHELEPLKRIEDNIHAHPQAAKLFDGAQKFEYAIEWTDQETGILCRCLIDLLMKVICDLKTARSTKAREFANDAYRLGYHRQASWYTDGIEAMYEKRLPFVFCAVKSDVPYTVECFELSADFLELGALQNREALNRIAECEATGKWEAPGFGKIVTIAPPGWTKYLDQWEMEQT